MRIVQHFFLKYSLNIAFFFEKYKQNCKAVFGATGLTGLKIDVLGS